MITEDYVSFEIAKMLKEKGFDESCQNLYRKTREILSCGTVNLPELTNSQLDNLKTLQAWVDKMFIYTCPTLQMAMKWLREVHEIFIRPNTIFLYPIRYYCEIFCYGDNLKTQQDVTTENFESPEEACEAAIKYCLENLI